MNMGALLIAVFLAAGAVAVVLLLRKVKAANQNDGPFLDAADDSVTRLSGRETPQHITTRPVTAAQPVHRPMPAVLTPRPRVAARRPPVSTASGGFPLGVVVGGVVANALLSESRSYEPAATCQTDGGGGWGGSTPDTCSSGTDL